MSRPRRRQGRIAGLALRDQRAGLGVGRAERGELLGPVGRQDHQVGLQMARRQARGHRGVAAGADLLAQQGRWRVHLRALTKSASTISAHFSPIMMVGALVLPLVSVGMIEASATRRPCDAVDPQLANRPRPGGPRPSCRCRSGGRSSRRSCAPSRAARRPSADARPGAISSPVTSFSGEVAISSRPLRMAASTPVRSCSVDRKLNRIAGGSAGSDGLDVDRAGAFGAQHVHVHGDALPLRDAPLVARPSRTGRARSRPSRRASRAPRRVRK